MILAIVDRLFHKDPARFNKLLVWVNWANSKGFANEMILQALQSLEAKEENKEPVVACWPYLTRAVEKIAQERQHDHYKHGDLNQVKDILREVFREVMG